jgi:hypothetical protein
MGSSCASQPRSDPREQGQPSVRAVSGQAGGELLRDDRIHGPPDCERGPDVGLGHPPGTQRAQLVLVETEQRVAAACSQRAMQAPLEADAIGVGERVEEAAEDGGRSDGLASS